MKRNIVLALANLATFVLVAVIITIPTVRYARHNGMNSAMAQEQYGEAMYANGMQMVHHDAAGTRN